MKKIVAMVSAIYLLSSGAAAFAADTGTVATSTPPVAAEKKMEAAGTPQGKAPEQGQKEKSKTMKHQSKKKEKEQEHEKK